ncbi:efflux RND transporter permease subunit [Poseidonibacter ostreae]|jgi:multidrug efflux pump subunit AcrB|uniref:AcrB/AcrD/AcrF family protein n=1 Tax=Poseidonibacter ostreae TaxID=2654171 RepID=A0A6L4WRC6_9BACT|nr:efflux RND transporter permease subunit [Poseidonibacter ostreae]KAB7886917.1 AcrB/AcrD/AcrF family protein [Poseidonibacter ostreae]KAB7887596.1 AcrB/AcrD/AcrF family protein [Poseidonibacter ostreae]KAB7892209.1 AcrB/AcrD/AcrF family protein [Poseidonibacter ostreae]
MKLENFIFNILESKAKSFLVYFITFVLFALSIATFPNEIIKAKMLPSKDSDTFSIYVDLKDGSSKLQTKEVTRCISSKLQKNEFVTNISIFIGEGQPLDFAAMVKQSALKDKQSQAEIMVNIKKAENREITSYNLISNIRENIQKNCSLYEANIKFIELPAGPPVLASIVAEIYGGNSFETRRNFSLKIAKILKEQATLVDIDVMADKDYIKYQLELDNNKIIKSGISLEQVKNILYLAYEGMEISVVNEEKAENQIPIFLRLDDSRLLENSTKKSLESKLQTLKLVNNQGFMINLASFITIKEIIKEPTLTSKNLNMMINVIAETNKDSQIYPLLDSRNQMLKELEKEFIITKTNMLNLSFEDKNTKEKFDLVFDGELKVTIDTFIDLGGAFIIALVLIFFLMVMYYKSFALSGGIVLASFISIVGVIFAHVIMDIITEDTFYLTATSLIGFIGLIGINSRNSTLIIDFSKQLVKEENLSINQAIARATATRSKPIILTVLTMVFASSLLATDAVFGGLGVALIGGTLISYIVSMFFVPVIIKNQLHKII